MEDTNHCNDYHILVTGGAGFIGSRVVNYLYRQGYTNLVVIDRIDYCSRKANIEVPVPLYELDLNRTLDIYKILETHNINVILHFAAQTHVDNSFTNVIDFLHSNVMGTYSLLEASRQWGRLKLLIHVSTDEVYGEVEFDEVKGCTEDMPLHPTNPYAATKASAEHLVLSYWKSYNLPVIITRGNNVYGPGQYPEKVIPKFILQMLTDKPITIQGTGLAQRTFIYVDDVARAFFTLMLHGKVGEIYNIGSYDEYSVISVAQRLQDLMGITDHQRVEIPDRNFNDRRYHIDTSKLHNLGWCPQVSFTEGLSLTIEWYRHNLEEFRSLVGH